MVRIAIAPPMLSMATCSGRADLLPAINRLGKIKLLQQRIPPATRPEMIRYSLKCAAEHSFDSWFQSAAAFDALAKTGHVTCPQCGSAEIVKTLMAPAVTPARKAGMPGFDTSGHDKPSLDKPLSTPSNPQEQALAALRAEVEANSDYVGKSFVAEARKMHEGTAAPRAIHGEARLDEARKLVEDGVPVMPLPFLPPRKVN